MKKGKKENYNIALSLLISKKYWHRKTEELLVTLFTTEYFLKANASVNE